MVVLSTFLGMTSNNNELFSVMSANSALLYEANLRTHVSHTDLRRPTHLHVRQQRRRHPKHFTNPSKLVVSRAACYLATYLTDLRKPTSVDNATITKACSRRVGLTPFERETLACSTKTQLDKNKITKQHKGCNTRLQRPIMQI